MKKIAITTDTNSGMLPGEYDYQGVFVLPMPFIINDECLLEGVELSREDFYEKLLSGATVSTSQPSITDLTDFWNKILEEYDEIVHIPTSSLLSNAFSTAKVQSESYGGKIHMVDNKRISLPLKSSVFDAVALRDSGKTAEEIAKTIEAQSADASVYFSLESMEYLKRGGRISPTVAAIGSILKLRPILHMAGGPLEKFATPRSLAKAKIQMLETVKAELNEKYREYVEKGEMQLGVVYGENKEDAEIFKNEIQTMFPNIPFLACDPMSLSVACHTGPKTIAICAIRTPKA